MGVVNFTAVIDFMSENFLNERYHDIRKFFTIKTKGRFIKKHVITLCICGKLNDSKSNEEIEIKNISNFESIEFSLRIEDDRLLDIIDDIEEIKRKKDEYYLKTKDDELISIILGRLNSMLVMSALE